jgi:hypothetical protein
MHGRKSKKESKGEAMAKSETNFLDTKDLFPRLEIPLVAGERLVLPEDLGEGYRAVLFYRGYW